MYEEVRLPGVCAPGLEPSMRFAAIAVEIMTQIAITTNPITIAATLRNIKSALEFES